MKWEGGGWTWLCSMQYAYTRDIQSLDRKRIETESLVSSFYNTEYLINFFVLFCYFRFPVSSNLNTDTNLYLYPIVVCVFISTLRDAEMNKG